MKKPRLCEVLGVEVGEEFTFWANSTIFCIDKNGEILEYQKRCGWKTPDVRYLCALLEHPEDVERNSDWGKSGLTATCVFVSQPMYGKTDDEIKAVRREIGRKVSEQFAGSVCLLESFFDEYEGTALSYLAKSIEFLSKADVAVFAEGWEKARGCVIQRMCCKKYGIPILNLPPKSNE